MLYTEAKIFIIWPVFDGPVTFNGGQLQLQLSESSLAGQTAILLYKIKNRDLACETNPRVTRGATLAPMPFVHVRWTLY